jgi:hypothetical protein
MWERFEMVHPASPAFRKHTRRDREGNKPVRGFIVCNMRYGGGQHNTKQCMAAFVGRHVQHLLVKDAKTRDRGVVGRKPRAII